MTHHASLLARLAALVVLLSWAPAAPSAHAQQDPPPNAEPASEPASAEPAPAQPAAPAPPAAAANGDPRALALEQAKTLLSPADPDQAAFLVRIDEAIDRFLRIIPANRQQEAVFRAETEGAPAQIAQFQAELDRTDPDPALLPPVLPPGQGPEERVATLESAQRALTERAQTVRSRIETIAQQRVDRAARRQAIPDELAAARARLDDVLDQLGAIPSSPAEGNDAPPDPDAPPDAPGAQRLVLVAEREYLQSLIARLEAERDRIEAVMPRADVRQRLAEAELEVLAESLRSVNAQLAQERERLAQERERIERERLSAVSPALEPLSVEVLATIQENTERSARLAALQLRAEEIRAKRDGVRQRSAEVEERVRTTRGGAQIGPLLRRVQISLPATSDLRTELRQLVREESRLQDRFFEVQDTLERVPSRNVDGARAYLAAVGVADPSPELIRETLELIGRHRETLDTLRETINGPRRLIESTQELALLLQTLEQEASELNDFISAQILWVRSDPAFSAVTLRYGVGGGARFFVQDGWSSLVVATWREMARAPGLLGAAVVAVAGLAAARVWSRRRLRVVNGLVSRPSTDRLGLTFQAVGLAALHAATIPVALWLLARLLTQAPDVDPHVQSLATQGLDAMARALFFGTFLLAIVRPRGLGETHFRWKAAATRSTRRHLMWYVPTFIVLLAVFASVWPADDDPELRSFARLVFLAIAVSSLVFAAIWLRPAGPLMNNALERAQWNGWRKVWPEVYGAILLALLALVIMNAVGWTLTATTLFDHMRDTGVILLVIVIARAIAMRWLLIARRRIAIEQHRRRIEAQRAAAEKAQLSAEAGTTAGAPVDVPVVETGPPEVDLSSVDQQTRGFVNLLVWLSAAVFILPVWMSVFPALRLLENVNIVTSETYNLSVADVIYAIIVGVVGVLTVRTVPNTLSGFILPRTGLDGGTQYAVTTLVRYTLVTLAAFMFFAAMKVNWGSLGWILAGASVGLGFGMQQIFANFISGIILLFERPVRPGDMVKIGETTGIVKQIRIRATVVQDWECRDVIVPNRVLIEQTLMNQTRSDRTCRVNFEVGVAYGSDTVLTERLLREVCEAHPETISSRATFDNFGDNALNFTVRNTIRDVDKRLDTVNELHQSVYKTLAEHGIEIAFPQRDLHLRDGELTVRLRRDDDEPRGGGA